MEYRPSPSGSSQGGNWDSSGSYNTFVLHDDWSSDSGDDTEPDSVRMDLDSTRSLAIDDFKIKHQNGVITLAHRDSSVSVYPIIGSPLSTFQRRKVTIEGMEDETITALAKIDVTELIVVESDDILDDSTSRTSSITTSTNRSRAITPMRPAPVEKGETSEIVKYGSFEDDPDRYIVEGILGEGSEGKAYLVTHHGYEGEKFVLKKKSCQNLEESNEALGEAMSLAQLSNRHIVKYRDVFIKNTMSNVYVIYIAMEFCPNGDLYSVLRRSRDENIEISQDVILKWMYQLVRGVRFIHRNNMLHRDLKLENVFLTKNNTIKIGDFGLTVSSLKKQSGRVGTAAYMAPEVDSGKGQLYGDKADIWSVGVIFLQMLLRDPDAYSRDEENLGKLALKPDYDPAVAVEKIKQMYPREAEVIKQILRRDPLKRWPADRIFKSRIFSPIRREKEESKKIPMMSPRQLIETATAKELPFTIFHAQIRSLMFDYFKNDPLWSLAIPNQIKREMIIKNYFVPNWSEFTARRGRIWGIVQDGVPQALLIYFSPDAKLVTSFISLIQNALRSPIKLGIKAFKIYYSNINKVQKIWQKTMNGRPHYRIMAPSPYFYGDAIGDLLLKPIVEWAKSEGVPIYHQVFSEKEVEWFQNREFEFQKKLELDNKLWVYVLIKDPFSNQSLKNYPAIK